MSCASATARVGLLILAGCGGAGPTGAEIGRASLSAASGGHPDKAAKPAPVKESKCAKADGGAWKRGFMLDGRGRHGSLGKMARAWTLVRALR